jgi:RNA recognition motif-containing protein
MNIYVGNLFCETTEGDLRQAFEAFGQFISVKILKDRVTGESHGFGFVGMPISHEGQTAISELKGKDLKGHSIKVEEGRMKTSPHSGRDRREGFDRGGRGGRRY